MAGIVCCRLIDGRDIDINGSLNGDEVDQSDEMRLQYLTLNRMGLVD